MDIYLVISLLARGWGRGNDQKSLPIKKSNCFLYIYYIYIYTLVYDWIFEYVVEIIVPRKYFLKIFLVILKRAFQNYEKNLEEMLLILVNGQLTIEPFLWRSLVCKESMIFVSIWWVWYRLQLYLYGVISSPLFHGDKTLCHISSESYISYFLRILKRSLRNHNIYRRIRYAL